MLNRPLNVCLITPSYRSPSRPDAVHYELNPRCRYVNFCITYSQSDSTYIEQQIEAVILQIHALQKRGLTFDIISFSRGGASGELDIPGLFNTPFMSQAFKRLASLCGKLVIAVGHTNDRVERLEALALQQSNVIIRDVPYAVMLYINSQAKMVSSHVAPANYILAFSAKELVTAIKERNIYSFHAYVDVFNDFLEQTTRVRKKVCELYTLIYYPNSDRIIINSGELFKNSDFKELASYFNEKCSGFLKKLDKNAIPNVYNMFIVGLIKNIFGELSSFERYVTIAVAQQIKDIKSNTYKIKGQNSSNTQHYLNVERFAQEHSIASEQQQLLRNSPRANKPFEQFSTSSQLNSNFYTQAKHKPDHKLFQENNLEKHKNKEPSQQYSKTVAKDFLELNNSEHDSVANNPSQFESKQKTKRNTSKTSRWRRFFSKVRPQPIPELSLAQIMNRGVFFVVLGVVAFAVDKFL